MNPLLTPLLEIVPKVFDQIFPDKAKADEAKLKLLELAQNGELAVLKADTDIALAQAEVNKIEAASDSLFKSGWRPFVGWTCGGGLFYQLLARPIFGWVAQNLWNWPLPPSLEMDTLMTLLFGLLGLGAYRTYEKTRK